MNRCFHFYEATLGMLGIGLGGFGDVVDSLDDGALLVDDNFEHATGLAAVFTAEDVNVVAFFDM